MFQYFSTVSNVADEGEEEKCDNKGQEQVSDNLESQIDDEMEDSQSTASASSNRITTPPPITPSRRPTPARGCIVDIIRGMLLRRDCLK